MEKKLDLILNELQGIRGSIGKLGRACWQSG